MMMARETSRKVDETMTTTEKLRALGLGFLVWWSLRDVRVKRADLRATFAQFGLDKAVPRDPRPSAVLARACRDALVGKGSEWQFDRVRDDADACVAALSQRTTDATAETVGYAQVGLIRVDKKTGAVAVVGGPDVLADAAARFYAIRDNATTEDLRSALTNAMRGRRRDLLLGAVDVNGVFFVRADQQAKLDGLRAWVESSGFGTMSVLSVADDDTSRHQLATGATRTIESRVKEVLAETAQIAERLRTAKEDEVDEILAPYLERFELAESAADLYADVLGNMAAELRGSIKSARAEFSRRVL